MKKERKKNKKTRDFFSDACVQCPIFGKLKISTILLNTIPAGIPVGGREPLQDKGKWQQNGILPAPS